MAALDLITLADLKTYWPASGTTRDPMLRTWISVVSRMLEAELGRRFVYRAPLEVAAGDNVVAEAALANGTPAVVQPNSAGRTLVVSLLDTDRSVSAGTLTISGTVIGGGSATEVFDLKTVIDQGFDPSGYARAYGSKFFTGSVVVTLANVAGAGAADKVRVGSSLGYVEFHSPLPGELELSSLEWPILGVAEVNEDAALVYGSGTKLVQGTDYALDVNEGRFTRLAGTLPFPWLCSWRAEKLVYAGGYPTTAGVPEDLKDLCRQIVVYLFQQVDKNRLGVAGATDSLGNWTRMALSQLKREKRTVFEEFRRRRYGTDTGEVAFDKEAA